MGTCKKNILVLTYWSYNDALIQTYTLPYVKLIEKNLADEYQIFLLTLEKKNTSYIKKQGKINFISFIYRPPGIMAIVGWMANLWKLLLLIRKNNISTIHAWCTPAGMFGYILSVLSGKELIIDSFEPHAEAMVENNTWKNNSLLFKLLFYFEKAQARRAKHLIAISENMRDYAEKKYKIYNRNFFVKPACVNLDLFSAINKKRKDLLMQHRLEGKIVCVYAGKFGGIYLDKEVFDFLKVAGEYWGDRFRVLLLTTESEESINKYCENSGFNKENIIRAFVPHEKVADYIGLADFAITPVKPIPTKKCCSPIKDGEYWALGLPVVITRDISDDSAIIEKFGIGSVIKSFEPNEYLRCVKEIDSLLSSNSLEELYKIIRPVAEKYRNFSIAEKIYSELYS